MNGACTTNIQPILLCEDDIDETQLMLAAIDENKLADRVDIVQDGQQALDYMHYRGVYRHRPPVDPACIFLSCDLPKVSGLEVLRYIKGDEMLRVIPVVMMASSVSNETMLEVYRIGANGLIIKPDDFHRFFDSIMGMSAFWGLINKPPVKTLQPAS